MLCIFFRMVKVGFTLPTFLSLFWLDLSKATEDVRPTLCRSRGFYFDLETYQDNTCALCYMYMPGNKFKLKWNIARTKLQERILLSDYSTGNITVSPSKK